MSADEQKYDMQFYQLVLSVQAAAWYQLGKVASPFSGKIERDLDAAKHSIDMLEMLQRKTTGNLNDEERKLLEHILYELRMNYVEESKKPASEEPSEKKPSETGEAQKSEEKPADREADTSGSEAGEDEGEKKAGPDSTGAGQ